MKYRELYTYGREKLMEAKIAEADLDARLLLEAVCNTSRNDLLVHGDSDVENDKNDTYVNYIEKRRKHIPLQHILGYQEFMGLRFHVNNKVLIPRQDTEILVEEVLKNLLDKMSILDMCTGSGCVLISLLHYSNDCIGTGVDISDHALEIARTNALEHHVTAEFIQSNLFENVHGKYDIIVSNPPYIASHEIEGLMKEVRDFEPVLALDGKEDGLFFYREIINQAVNYLYSGASLFFEIGYNQGEEVSLLMKEAGFQEVEIVKDFAGLDRVVYGCYR
jgi:release factor glutamine methyltransferase